jgi:hypothetical protein
VNTLFETAKAKRIDVLPKLTQERVVGKLDDDFLCAICHDVVSEMRECIKCETLYCYDCAT